MNDLSKIAAEFNLGAVLKTEPLGSGHIHATYKITTTQGVYVLQQVNTHVFSNQFALEHNIGVVTAHLSAWFKKSGADDTTRHVLTPVITKDGGMHVTDHERIWRCFIYIRDHKTYNRATNESMVFEGGRAYGRFLAMLSDLSSDILEKTIPGFHDMTLRFSQYEHALKSGIPERIQKARKVIDLLLMRKTEMMTIQRLGQAGLIPVRIVHHDTKINNVLFDDQNRALCVIDLDTVMPGYVHDDFGDSVRTFTNTGEEDDVSTDNVSMHISFFKAFAQGYLKEAGRMLTKTETDLLALSARVMTCMQALRFLTDYLNGDTYYHIVHPEHNLQRTRAQVALMLSMEAQYDEMVKIIRELS